MLKILIIKEFKNIIQSPKFVATFITGSVLILLSIFIGIQEYRTNIDQYNTGIKETNQELREETSWGGASIIAHRKPDPMQIFISGVNNDIGRLANISHYSDISLRNSNYSDNPIFAYFRFMDLAFIIQVVLSLIAILFTYDAINGERETGTMKLVFANSVSRFKYLIAKWFGSWIGLIIPLLIPISLGLLLVLVFNVPLKTIHWIKLGNFFVISTAYFTFFITFGLLISTLTRESATSFLILIVSWIVFVLLVPRIGTMAAGQLVSVPGTAEIESQKSAFENDLWDKHERQLAETWNSRNAASENMTPEERKQYQDEQMWTWMQEDDEVRKNVQQEIAEMGRKMREDLRNRKIQQEKLGFLLSRFSPASSYQLAVMNLAGTDIGLKYRYEQAMEEYKNQFTSFVDNKQKESGETAGIRVMMDSENGISINSPDLNKTIDTSEIPQFQEPSLSYASVFSTTVMDLGLLIIYSAVSLFLALVAFIRYDVR